MRRDTIIKVTAALLGLGVLLLLGTLALRSPSQPNPTAPPSSPDTTLAAVNAAFSGEVLDSSGAPLQGITLSIKEEQVTTDPLGRFAFQTLPSLPGTLTLPDSLALPVHLSSIPLPDDLSAPLRLTIPTPATFRGKLLAGGLPLQNASISLLYLDASTPGGPAEPFTLDAIASTDAGGAFDLSPMLPGRIQLLIEAPGHPFVQSRELTLEPGQKLLNFSLDIAPNTLLSIELLSEDGDPLPGDLIIRGASASSIQRHRTDPQGKLTLQGLPADLPLTLIAHARGHRHASSTITLDPSDPTTEQIVLEDTADAFVGMVVGPDYQPVPNASVLMLVPNTRNQMVRTDRDGHFTWPRPDGTSSIQAQVFSHAHPPSSSATLLVGEEHLFTLDPGGFISGQVITSGGKPVTSYTLSVSDFRPLQGPGYTRKEDFARPTIAHPSGTFTYGPLRPGTYYLEAQPGDVHASAESSPITVSAAQTTSNITLTVQQPGRVTGVVLDNATQQPLPNAAVALTSTNQATLTATTNARGEYTLENVPPGRQSVRVSLNQYTTQFAAGVQVSPGGSTTQNIQMEKGTQNGFSFHGIGAGLDRDQRGLRIRNLMPGSPARDAGVLDGDYILSVDGKSTDSMRVIDAVEVIRGQEGTPVTLDIQRPDAGRLTITVIRGKVSAR